MSYYRDIVIQTYENFGEPSRKRVRARPAAGQGFSTALKVECSAAMRESYPIGTFFIVNVKITDRLGGTPFLYRHYSWSYEVVTAREAKAFIKKH